MIGLGTQDDLSRANDFVDEYGLSFRVLWDESNYSWQVIGVSSQPAALLLDTDGTPITGWFGSFPEDEVLRLAAAAGG